MTKIALLMALVTAAGNHVGLERPTSEADLLRAYGFAKCLAKAYDKTSFGEDAERVADLYFQMGRVSRPEIYDHIGTLAESLDAAKPSIVDGHNFAIMACLEFYEGSKLRQVARTALARPTGKR